MAATQLVRSLTEQLEQVGYAVLASSSLDPEALCREFGDVIDTTEVRPDTTSRSLVTSNRGLDFHTDHHRARLIVWHCLRQCELGGETILVDARAAYETLTPSQQVKLRGVRLFEHSVFPDDQEDHPLVTVVDGQPRFYFSFWFVEPCRNGPNKAALNAFMDGIRTQPVIKLRLEPGEVLIVDNYRMLHGRSPILVGDRHLRRYWIAEKGCLMNAARTNHTVVPDPITSDRIAQLVAAGITMEIAEIDLEMVKLKLREPKEGIGWTVDQCEDAEVEYKRYLTLCKRYPYPDYSIVPNKIMDTMWHYHILDTRAYHKDCDRVFGHYFHHFPYFGLRGEQDEQNLKAAFERTKELYAQLFGEPMARNRESDCWHDCEDRCWHACSDDK